jgi:hypothetical protein
MPCTRARAHSPSGQTARERRPPTASAGSGDGTAPAGFDCMSTTIDLKSRVEATKQELIKKLGALKDSTESDAAVARDAIKKRLSELAHVVKEGVVDGWDTIGDVAKTRLNRWLDN